MYDYYKIEPKKQGKLEIPAPLVLQFVCADQLSRDLLESALLISRINEREKGDQGESARIMHTLGLPNLSKASVDDPCEGFFEVRM
jgi:hypothetical protein